MSLSSPPPRFAERELPTSGQKLRALRGREEIARLTARLRLEHSEYESVSQSWSPEAGEKKKELRKARSDTLVEVEAALTRLGEVERFREMERLPFEQKVVLLEAFLEHIQGGSAAPSPEGSAHPDAIPHTVAQPSMARPELGPMPQAPCAASEPAPPAPLEIERADAIAHAIPEPPVAHAEPGATPVAPRAANASAQPASMRPRSIRPPSRRHVGHWPVRLAPSAMPRAATWRVPLLVGVIAVQGLALALLSLAVLRNGFHYSESSPSRTATSNATATAIAPPLPPPPATRSADSCIPSAQPVPVPAVEPRPAAAAQTPRLAAPPPHPPARSQPAAVPSLPALTRRPEIFVPDSL